MRFRDCKGFDVRGFGDGSNAWTTIADTLGGITNPAAAGAAVFAAQQPITVQGPPVNYTPILIGGSVVLLAALFLKRSGRL